MQWLKRLIFFSPRNYCQVRTVFAQSKCIFEWKNQVEKNGTLTVKSPVHVVVEPLDVYEVPYGDRADVYMYQNTGDNKTASDDMDLAKFHPRISVEETHIKVDVPSKVPPEISQDLVLKVSVPHQYCTNIHSHGTASATLKNLEGNSHSLESDNGNCLLHKVKSCSVTVRSKSGDVLCKDYVLGDIDVQTGQDGTISMGRLQGKHVKLKSLDGAVSVASLYAGNAEFETQDGDVTLGHIHGWTTIKTESGSVSIKSASDDVTACSTNGDINIHMMESKNIHLTSKNGSITASVTPDWSGSLELSAPTITGATDIVKEEIKDKEGSSAQGCLHACAPHGTITLSVKSGFEFNISS